MTSLPSPSDRILLVEGQDDEHVVRHICGRHQLEPTFCIKDKRGIKNLLGSISSEIKVSGRRAVGILVDSNDDLDARWKAVTDQLQQANISVTSPLDQTGTIIDSQDNQPRIGIWLMPNNAVPGELEDFVIQMIPDDDPVWLLSQCYIDNIPEADRKFSEGKTLRAKLHAWLAAREEPRKMGSAIGTCDLNVDGTLCQNFLAWLKRLFA